MSKALLLLDIGNSRIKWGLYQDGEWFADGMSTHDKMDSLLQEWDRFPDPGRILGCNVADESIAARISRYWQGRSLDPIWLESQKTGSGITNLYDQPAQLGTDRWAALVGAWHRAKGSCLVISAGTALTIDMLNKNGEFIGGFILPGRYLMYDSLATGTHALSNQAGKVVESPRNTADGMTSGIAMALASAVQSAYQRLASEKAPTPICIVTGGDAEWLANQLQIGVIIAPKLVLEGLSIMAQGVDQG